MSTQTATPLPIRAHDICCVSCQERGKLTTTDLKEIGKSLMCKSCREGTDEWTQEEIAERLDRKRAQMRIAVAVLHDRVEANKRQTEEERQFLSATIARRQRYAPARPVSAALALAAEAYQMDPARLLVRTNAWTVCRPRQLAFRIAHDLFDISYPRIGKTLGFHHTTVMHAVHRAKVTDELIAKYEEIKRQIEATQ